MNSDPNIIQGKLEIIRNRLRFLENEEHDLTVLRHRQAVKHTLQQAIEACLDIANHIILAEGFGRPENYADYFPRLARHDILPTSLASELSEMAKFRNVLVHLYAEVDTDTVRDVLNNDLGDNSAFAEVIYAYIESPE